MSPFHHLDTSTTQTVASHGLHFPSVTALHDHLISQSQLLPISNHTCTSFTDFHISHSHLQFRAKSCLAQSDISERFPCVCSCCVLSWTVCTPCDSLPPAPLTIALVSRLCLCWLLPAPISAWNTSMSLDYLCYPWCWWLIIVCVWHWTNKKLQMDPLAFDFPLQKTSPYQDPAARYPLVTEVSVPVSVSLSPIQPNHRSSRPATRSTARRSI